jgi:hypothetical protein
LINTAFEDADAGSCKASCVFMDRSYPGQVLVRNLCTESAHISAGYPWLSQKTGPVLVHTPDADFSHKIRLCQEI